MEEFVREDGFKFGEGFTEDDDKMEDGDGFLDLAEDDNVF